MGGRRRTPRTACGSCSATATALTWWAVIVHAGLANGRSRTSGSRCGGCCRSCAAKPMSTAPLVFHALGLAEWHWATRHCPRCGGSLFPRAAGHELVCEQCGKPQFPRTDPAVIMVVAAGSRATTMSAACSGAGRSGRKAGSRPWPVSASRARRSRMPSGARSRRRPAWSSVRWTYFGNQAWPLPSSLMLGFIGRGFEEIRLDDAEIEEARWFTRGDMREAGGGGRAGAARRGLDQPVNCRALVRRPAAGQLVSAAQLPPARRASPRSERPTGWSGRNRRRRRGSGRSGCRG